MRTLIPSSRHHPALIFLLLAFTSIASAQPVWESLKGPYGGHVGFLAANASGEIYAMTYDVGLFRSSDEGRSWKQPQGVSYMTGGGSYVHCMATADSNLVLIATNAPQSLHSSTDHGATWCEDTVAGEWFSSIAAISWSPHGIVFALSDNGIAYRSTDRAVMWEQCALVPWHVSQVTVDSTGRIFALFDSSGVFRSLDDGLHWESVNKNLPDSGIGNIITVGSVALVAASRSGSIFVSTDAGDHWNVRGNIHDQTYGLAASPTGDLIASTDTSGLLRSTDLGFTWTHTNLSSTGAGTFIVLANGDYVDAHDLQISVSTDNGVTWLDRTSNMAGIRPTCLALLPGYVLVGTDYGVFARWESALSRWDVFPLQPFGIHVNSILATSFNTIFIGPSEQGLQQSTDLGSSWTWPQAAGNRVLFESQSGTLFSSTGRQGDESGWLFRSTNGGATWIEIDIADRIINSIVESPEHILFAGTDAGYYMHRPMMLKSTDDGITWNVGTRMDVMMRAFDSSGTLYASTTMRDEIDSTGHSYTPPDSLLRSSDNGTTWTCADTTFIGPMVVNQRGDIFLAGGWSSAYGRVKRSTNGGKSWQEYSSGLDGGDIESIIIDTAGFVYCATWNGGLYRSIQSTLDVRTAEEIPTRISLAPNFPNPFSESTTLNYTLGQGAHVRLSVIDAVGRERALLVDERQSSGAHATCFSAGAYATGAYTMRLLVNGSVYSRMVVIDR